MRPSAAKITAAFRAGAVQKVERILDGADDPLTAVAAMIVDQSLGIQTRLSAASIALPYLYPRLSSTQIDARHTVTKIDSTDLLRRLDERIARLTPPPPTALEDMTEPATEVTIAAADDEAGEA